MGLTNPLSKLLRVVHSLELIIEYISKLYVSLVATSVTKSHDPLSNHQVSGLRV